MTDQALNVRHYVFSNFPTQVPDWGKEGISVAKIVRGVVGSYNRPTIYVQPMWGKTVTDRNWKCPKMEILQHMNRSSGTRVGIGGTTHTC